MTDCQHRLSAPSDRCHPQRSESTETPAAPFSTTYGNCLVVHSQMFTCVHVLREDKLTECGHVVTIREKSRRRTVGWVLTLTHVGGIAVEVQRFIFKFCEGSFECISSVCTCLKIRCSAEMMTAGENKYFQLSVCQMWFKISIFNLTMRMSPYWVSYMHFL